MTSVRTRRPPQSARQRGRLTRRRGASEDRRNHNGTVAPVIPHTLKCSAISELSVWRNRCISTPYEIEFVKNAELGPRHSRNPPPEISRLTHPPERGGCQFWKCHGVFATYEDICGTFCAFFGTRPLFNCVFVFCHWGACANEVSVSVGVIDAVDGGPVFVDAH